MYARSVPETHEYANPFKWGWYYVESGVETSGLMSKRAARKLLRERMQSGFGGYGLQMAKHPNAPRLTILRRITFPIRKVAKPG